MALCFASLMLLAQRFSSQFGPAQLLGLVFNDLKAHTSFSPHQILSIKVSSELLAESVFLFYFNSIDTCNVGKKLIQSLHCFQVDIFIRKMNSIPAFTANLSVESFNRRTLS